MVYYKNGVLMFSYGMNTNRALMQLRCKDAVVVGTGFLCNHQLDFRYHCDVTLTDDQRNRVYGVIWQLSREDLDLIDLVEGYPEYYARERVHIVSKQVNTGTIFTSWTYKMNNQEGLELPDERYYDLVKQGYEENNLPIKQLHDALDRCNLYMEANYG